MQTVKSFFKFPLEMGRFLASSATIKFSRRILRHASSYGCLTVKFVTFCLLSSVGIVMPFSEIIQDNSGV